MMIGVAECQAGRRLLLNVILFFFFYCSFKARGEMRLLRAVRAVLFHIRFFIERSL